MQYNGKNIKKVKFNELTSSKYVSSKEFSADLLTFVNTQGVFRYNMQRYLGSGWS